VFTSPSSVTDATRATRAGNARLHRMITVTPRIAPYIISDCVQVCFCLGSSATFSRTDTTTDSELFYNSLYDFITHPDEAEELSALLEWWNRCVF
ncbi:hypothetical protein L227DRAFT_482516, partial [Lentinus tigrinus ALCF2SS1-6]